MYKCAYKVTLHRAIVQILAH